MTNFGGHDFAAGLTIKEQNIEEFKRRFITAAEVQLHDTDVATKLHLDAEVNFHDLTFDLMESIKLWNPMGMKTRNLFCTAKLNRHGRQK